MTAWSLWHKDICRSFQSTFSTAHTFSAFAFFCGCFPPLVCSKKVECSSIRLRSADEDFPPTRLRPIPLCASALLSRWIVKRPLCFDAFGSTWAHRNLPANLCIYPAACSVSEIIKEYQRTGASGSRNDDGGALIMSLFFFIRLTEVKFCFIRPKNFVPQHCLTFVHFCELMLGLSVSESYQMLHAFILETIEDLCSHKCFFFWTIQMGCHFQVSCVHRLFFVEGNQLLILPLISLSDRFCHVISSYSRSLWATSELFYARKLWINTHLAQRDIVAVSNYFWILPSGHRVVKIAISPTQFFFSSLTQTHSN